MTEEQQTADIATMAIVDLADLSMDLWDLHFKSPKKDKGPIRDRYNDVVNAYNKRVNFKAFILIDDKTKDSPKLKPVRDPVPPPPKAIIEMPIGAGKENGICAQVIALFQAGHPAAEIVRMGFSRSTVGVQISKYKKSPGYVEPTSKT